MMEVVNSRSAEDIARKHAEWELVRAINELAGNFLRVIAGAGRTHELVTQAERFHDAYVKFAELSRGYIYAVELTEKELRSWERDYFEMYKHSPDYAKECSTEDSIATASLRIVAARLLGQNVQVTRHHSKLIDALMDWEKHREERFRRRG